MQVQVLLSALHRIRIWRIFQILIFLMLNPDLPQGTLVRLLFSTPGKLSLILCIEAVECDSLS